MHIILSLRPMGANVGTNISNHVPSKTLYHFLVLECHLLKIDEAFISAFDGHTREFSLLANT
jgi:hypothetical protein